MRLDNVILNNFMPALLFLLEDVCVATVPAFELFNQSLNGN
jgi:hypothetical protein